MDHFYSSFTSMICQNVTMHHVNYSLTTPSCSNLSLLQSIVPNCNWTLHLFASSETRSPPSILGPLLFLIYINDLPECNYASCQLFADDTKLLKSVITSIDCTQLQLDLTSLEQRCNTWRLNLNQHKRTHLRLSLKPS